MAHLIPPHYPAGTSPGEVLIFRALASAPASWVVLHSLHLPEHVRQIEGEADFVVLIPSLGVLCLEVKGHLSADFRSGAWYLGANPAPDYRGPFRQAEEAARSIKKKVTGDYPDASRLLFWPVVVFTHCVPSVGAATGEWHSWQLLSRSDLDREPLGDLLLQAITRARDFVSGVRSVRWFDPRSQSPTPADCQRIQRILRPDVHFIPATDALRRERQAEIRRFTDEQLEIVEGLDGVNAQALIEGPAGTGKTVLAIEEARRAASLGRRVLLVCYNQQLSELLQATARDLGIQDVTVLTFHALLRRVAGDAGPEAHQGVSEERYWREFLPDLTLARLLESGPLFDVLIVDEAQDLAEEAYLDIMDALLVGELREGEWRMFGDFERQSIFVSDAGGAVRRILRRSSHVARFRLRRNCRNTPRVAEYIVRLGGLDPSYTKILRPDAGVVSTPRTLFYRSAAHQEELLQATLDEWIGSGEFDEEDVVVLSPSTRSCAAGLPRHLGAYRLEALPLSPASGAIHFGTVASFKGLEAPAVILTDIEEIGTDFAQRLFYTGISRATDRLRVLARDGLQGALASILSGASSNA